jgi:hypothetical protein
MEKTLYISDLKHLNYFFKDNYSRIYFGSEFCELLLPTSSKLKKILLFCKDHNISFTLVTPFLSNKGLQKTETLLKLLPPQAEVIFNDYGLLEIITKYKLRPVHGRLLLETTKDPRIKFSSKWLDYFKISNLQNNYLSFLKGLSITRIELDNISQGYNIKLPVPFTTSLYYPYVVCSVTRKCIYANRSSKIKFKVINKCSKECRKLFKSEELIKYKPADKYIYVIGNSQFYINNNLILLKNKKLHIDRLVYMPVYPC